MLEMISILKNLPRPGCDKQWKEIEENNRMGKVEISSRKLDIPGNISCKVGKNKEQKRSNRNRRG